MKQFDHGGDIYSLSNQEYNIIGDFSANINPLGMSPKGLSAIKDNLHSLIHYPDPMNHEIIEKISKKYDINRESVVMTNGASEIIYALCAFNRNKRAIIIDPTFSEYSHGAGTYNLKEIHLQTKKEEDFKVRGSLFDGIELRESILFLGHPNNPDGQLLDRDILLYLLKRTDETTLFVIDESFIDFVKDGYSFRNLVSLHKNLIIIHSLTKFFAVPGLRVGASYMNKKVADKIRSFIPTWSLNRLAQVYGAAALEDEVYYNTSRNFMEMELVRVYNSYSALQKIRPLRGNSNFLLMELDKQYDLKAFELYLKNKGFLIRNCSSYANLKGQWFRIAIKTRPLNDSLYNAIKEFIND